MPGRPMVRLLASGANLVLSIVSLEMLNPMHRSANHRFHKTHSMKVTL